MHSSVSRAGIYRRAISACIPGSSNEQHIIEDYDVWDFELSEDEMLRMNALEKDERFADY